MMDITPKIEEGTKLITGYNEDKIFINKESHNSKIILSNNEIYSHSVENISDLTVNDMKKITDDIIEGNYQDEAIILIGYKQEGSISKELKNELYKMNLGFDVMSNHAAYRTYNVLVSESRRIYAILF